MRRYKILSQKEAKALSKRIRENIRALKGLKEGRRPRLQVTAVDAITAAEHFRKKAVLNKNPWYLWKAAAHYRRALWCFGELYPLPDLEDPKKFYIFTPDEEPQKNELMECE